MTPKSGPRFSDKVMLKTKSMTPKSGPRFSDKVMLTKSMIPKRGCGYRRSGRLPI